ncbi:kinase-like protein [Bimuria novae-zelandiae CBS 107.79]|uniref:non-specific serine/threonine protein kinase n=1 Tax=Bimuria novae-zelandiae CBS 107.79 TaxID=1447943 RepID=A0A6A5UZR8_9PLEO|nr:kinase-like protein [Bimuria novae-zelandiae CBS 107.79]
MNTVQRMGGVYKACPDQSPGAISAGRLVPIDGIDANKDFAGLPVGLGVAGQSGRGRRRRAAKRIGSDIKGVIYRIVVVKMTREGESGLALHPTPIAEEDESTASEPTEPLTPQSHDSDSTPFTNPFRNNETVDFLAPPVRTEDGDVKTMPAATPRAARAASPMSPSPSNFKVGASGEPHASSTPEKLGFGKRAASFVRDKLHRAGSHREGPSQNDKKDAHRTEQAGMDGLAEVLPAVDVPRAGRRFSALSLSGRNTPKSSDSISPPEPASPSSTISNERNQGEMRLANKNSASSAAVSSMAKERTPGVKWAGHGLRGGKRHTWTRRRSASTEQVPKIHPEDEKPTTDLMATYSKPASRGVGMRARRLSLSLPEEFVVDFCDLDREFKSSSLMPGKRGKILGKGATSEVRIMARKGFGKSEDLVAVKEFRARDNDESEADYIDKIKSEYSIAKSLHHPNIVETVRLCTSRGRWSHVMEYCAYGELYSLVERKLFGNTVDGYYSLDDRLCFFKQLLRGVQYLHDHGIAHRDIKLENLLLDKEGHLKISDFGVAEVFSGEHPGLRRAGGECGKNMGEVRFSDPGICGSLPYIAPEVLDKRGRYDPRPLDVWSCAIVYLTMSFGGNPWQAARSDFPHYSRFKKGWDEWLPSHPDGEISVDDYPKCGKLFSLINPPPIKCLMLKMLHPDPDKRITIREVLDTACVKNINCCCLESYDDPSCCVDASKLSNARSTPPKKYLHHHIPPKPEHRLGKAFHHRFDAGDGH